MIYLNRMMIVLLFALTGCGSSQKDDITNAIKNIDTPFASSAISLKIVPDAQLNSLNDIPNSCSIIIVQAQYKHTLQQLIDNPVQIRQLFIGAGGAEDILKVDRYIAMPGQTTTLHLDRSENAKYVAVIAGYFPFPNKQHLIVMDIPVETKSHGWLLKEWEASLVTLNETISLGKESIRIITSDQEMT